MPQRDVFECAHDGNQEILGAFGRQRVRPLLPVPQNVSQRDDSVGAARL